MSFCTAVNCMDGRVQVPVIDYCKKRFGALYVDMVTEPGPNKILAEKNDPTSLQSIMRRIDISTDKHRSLGIVVAGHYDCAGNPAGEERQKEDTGKAVAFLKKKYPNLPVIGLWVDDRLQVSEIE